MVEALFIIAALGGLEFALWRIDRKGHDRQIELLDSIWTELALLNASQDDRPVGESSTASVRKALAERLASPPSAV
jgi:hypothetical protein